MHIRETRNEGETVPGESLEALVPGARWDPKFRAGRLVFKCTRSPAKESAILELTRGRSRFMQGHTVVDKVGNGVRIIDFVHGKSLFNYVPSIC